MNDPDRRHRSNGRLRHALQPVPLSPEQRRRHRHLIDDAFNTRQMESTRLRGKFELAVVAIALLAVIATALVWGSLAEGEDDEPDDLEAARATLTVMAQQQATAGALTTAVMAAQPSYDPDSCAATPFATILPSGIPRQDPAFANWYGAPGGGLWAAPVDRSAFRQAPVTAETHWFAGPTSFVMWYGTTQPLEIVGRRVDGDGTFSAGIANHVSPEMSAQWTAFEIPTPGCWMITAHAGDASLEIIVSVAPLEWRPDIIYLNRIAAARPYDVPSSCVTSSVLGPESTSGWYVAANAVQSDGMLMSINQGWLAADRAEPLHIMGAALAGGADIYARRSGVVISFHLRQESREGRFGDIEFRNPGCWEIVVETPTRVTSFTVYVYPADCAPSNTDLSIPASCREPGA